MSPEDRARMAVLDTVLLRRRAAVESADRRALAALQRAGFRFRSVAEAMAFQDAGRESARVEAARVTRMHEVTRRSA